MGIDHISYSDIRLGIVCPLGNEIATVKQFVNEVIDVCEKCSFKEIIFYAILDKVSKDGTLAVLKEMEKSVRQLKVIYAPENRNVVDAYKKGYKEALVERVDWVLEMDAGYSHRPVDMPRFFELMLKGNYSCVFGSRFCPGGKMLKGSLKKHIVSRGGSFLTNLLLGTKLFDMNGGFELFKREALEHILSKGVESQGPFFQTEIRAFAHKFSITECPIEYDASTGHARKKEIEDALRNLRRLFKMRIKGQLII